MLRARIIPCLLVKDGGLVKTVRFASPKYVGDPINAVRILNEKEIDELIVLDIDATRLHREPEYGLIGHLAAECRMPLCYGGGVTAVEQARRIIAMGVEKVALSAVAAENPRLIGDIATAVGSQSVVVVLDVKRQKGGRWQVWTHNGTKATGREPEELAKQAENLGAGEIVLNSIDNDGVMQGYDLELARRVRDCMSLPLTVLGGAGSLADIHGLIEEFGLIGAAAGSLFVFKGVYRAVLINYPTRAEKDKLVASKRQVPV
ncbi:MAG: imidazole glycerol phosphate synthase subunit HisF [Gammaproteobacteria bacterium]|nr:imidazole glycerol phosphate synthase subunit HisF [Gammaproteobacteria bacterium]